MKGERKESSFELIPLHRCPDMKGSAGQADAKLASVPILHIVCARHCCFASCISGTGEGGKKKRNKIKHFLQRV